MQFNLQSAVSYYWSRALEMVNGQFLSRNDARQCDQIGLWQLLKPWPTINLLKSPTFLGSFFKGVKIFPFSSEIIFGQLFTGHTDKFISLATERALPKCQSAI